LRGPGIQCRADDVGEGISRVWFLEPRDPEFERCLYSMGWSVSTREHRFLVWNDLQYIRVNGAVVGALVGLVLAVISAALPR